MTLLTGAKPVFIVHKSHQHAAALPQLLTHLTQTLGPDLELGAAIYLSRQPEAATRAFLSGTTVGLRLADPELHAHISQRGAVRMLQAQAQHRYLVDPLPTRPDANWISNYLEMQRNVGATALLTPTGWLPGLDPQREINGAMDWVRATRAINPAEPLVVSLALPRTWLESPPHLAALLRELIDSNEVAWYVRVLWPPMTPRYGQLRESGLLRGYRELASTASGEGKVLILPNSGFLGWLATGWGASGLSAGMGMAEQAFAEIAQVRTRRGAAMPPRKSRYFEPGLLHTVDLDTHIRLLAEQGYVSCTCPYCQRLRAAAPTANGTWDRDQVALHYLVQLATFLSHLNVRHPRPTARTDVRAARAFWDGLTVKPIGENVPQHLEIWDQLLA